MEQDSATTRSIEGRAGPAITVGLDVGDRYTHVHALGTGDSGWERYSDLAPLGAVLIL